MARCPNCSYLLVLLPKRTKYKCSKCSKLWFQKFIDTREFRSWNNKQRELDLHNLGLEVKSGTPSQRKILSEIEKRRRRKRYYIKNREKILALNRKWRINNKEYDKKRHKEYYNKNKAVIKFRTRKYQLKNRERIKERKRNYRLRKINYFRALDRERYGKYGEKIRKQQNQRYKLKRALTDMFSENNKEKPCKAKINMPNAHFPLCELLVSSINL